MSKATKNTVASKATAKATKAAKPTKAAQPAVADQAAADAQRKAEARLALQRWAAGRTGKADVSAKTSAGQLIDSVIDATPINGTISNAVATVVAACNKQFPGSVTDSRVRSHIVFYTVPRPGHKHVRYTLAANGTLTVLAHARPRLATVAS